MVKKTGLAVLMLLAGAIVGLAGSASATGNRSREVTFDVTVRPYVDLHLVSSDWVYLGEVGLDEYLGAPMPTGEVDLIVHSNCRYRLAAYAHQGRSFEDMFLKVGNPVEHLGGNIVLRGSEDGVPFSNSTHPDGVSLRGVQGQYSDPSNPVVLLVKPDSIQGRVPTSGLYTANVLLQVSIEP